MAEHPVSGVDLVLIGREATRGRDFLDLRDDLRRALRKAGVQWGGGEAEASPAAWVAIGGIRVYQWTIRPLTGSHCRFWPSCSEYAIDALRQHGAVRGGALAAWRILRCNPWHEGGWDPVPEPAAQRGIDGSKAAGSGDRGLPRDHAWLSGLRGAALAETATGADATLAPTGPGMRRARRRPCPPGDRPARPTPETAAEPGAEKRPPRRDQRPEALGLHQPARARGWTTRADRLPGNHRSGFAACPVAGAALRSAAVLCAVSAGPRRPAKPSRCPATIPSGPRPAAR